MGEGIVDNRLTRHKFWLVVESLPTLNIQQSAREYQMPSLYATTLANSLNYPPHIYFVEKWDENSNLDLRNELRLTTTSLPCDLHLVNIRTLTEPDLPLFPSKSALLIFQRFGFDCKINDNLMENICKEKSIHDKLFKEVQIQEIRSTSLTGLQQHGWVKKLSDIRMEPIELKTFNVTFY